MRVARRHLLNIVLWPLLQLVWEPFSRKQSHFWHWHKYSGEVSFAQQLEGDRNSKIPRNFWADFYQKNFGWQTAVELEPSDYKGLYQIGFYGASQYRSKKAICDLILSGQSAALLGGADVAFFALAYPSGLPIPLKPPRVTTKWALLPTTILI